MIRIFTATLFFLIINQLAAQTLRITNLDVSDEGQVSFTALVDSHHSWRETYELKVYSSADDYKKSLGLNLSSIKAGNPLDVSFNGPQVIGNFKGSIQFKFVAEASAFPVEITMAETKFKRGKAINISWKDYHEAGWYDVEMYREGSLFKEFVGNHRGTSYTAELPKKMPKGEYEIKVTPTNNKDMVSENYVVSVKGGSAALVVGAGGALAAGAGAVLLGGGGGGGGTTTDTGGNDLPNPPDPGS